MAARFVNRSGRTHARAAAWCFETRRKHCNWRRPSPVKRRWCFLFGSLSFTTVSSLGRCLSGASYCCQLLKTGGVDRLCALHKYYTVHHVICRRLRKRVVQRKLIMCSRTRPADDSSRTLLLCHGFLEKKWLYVPQNAVRSGPQHG